MSDFAPWQEWGERCAAELCSDDNQAALHEFAGTNWYFWLGRASRGIEIPHVAKVSNKDAWQWFEKFCWVNQTRMGKSKKCWLFARLGRLSEGTPADIVRSGASRIMRDVVRDFLRREGPMRLPGQPRPERSISDVSEKDLLPDMRDPSREAEFRELEQLAVVEAAEMLTALTERQRIAITAKVLGLALSNPKVEKIAGCKKSVLSVELDNAYSAIERKFNRDYADEHEQARSEMRLEMSRAIHNMCLNPKNEPEMWQSRLFSLAADIEQ